MPADVRMYATHQNALEARYTANPHWLMFNQPNHHFASATPLKPADFDITASSARPHHPLAGNFIRTRQIAAICDAPQQQLYTARNCNAPRTKLHRKLENFLVLNFGAKSKSVGDIDFERSVRRGSLSGMFVGELTR